MAFILPASHDPIRTMFDDETLASVGNREMILSLFDARTKARRILEDSAVTSVAFIVVSANGLAELVNFTRHPEAGVTHCFIWTFGKV